MSWKKQKKANNMEPFIIEAIPKKSPRIEFIKNKLSIIGHSIPEDGRVFYTGLGEYIKKYKEKVLEPNKENIEEGMPYIYVYFHLEYMNTSSNQALIYNVFRELEEYGEKIHIQWRYNLEIGETDEENDIREKGEDYAEMYDFKFEYLGINAETDEPMSPLKIVHKT